jgi:hypothetical protein
MHESGKRREEAERLAAQHAERFSLELLKAIRKALLQSSGLSADASASKNCETRKTVAESNKLFQLPPQPFSITHLNSLHMHLDTLLSMGNPYFRDFSAPPTSNIPT